MMFMVNIYEITRFMVLNLRIKGKFLSAVVHINAVVLKFTYKTIQNNSFQLKIMKLGEIKMELLTSTRLGQQAK